MNAPLVDDTLLERQLNYLLDKYKKEGSSMDSQKIRQEGKEFLKEVFDEKQFTEQNGKLKYTGGWNEEQDTANINKLFNPLKEEVQNKLDVAKKAVDTKLEGVDSKLKEADEQLKTKLTQVQEGIDNKLKEADAKLTEASNEVKDKLKELKPEVVKIIVEELKDPKSKVSAELRDFLDPDNFYPLEWKDGDIFPKDRAGKAKNQKDIALMQAEFNAEIKAQEEWLKFFNRHNIQDDNDREVWKSKFKSNTDGAESVYGDSLLEATNLVKGEDPLGDLEKNRINRATTPDKIKEVLKDIPIQRNKYAWDNFFKEVDKDKNIKEEWKEYWLKSGLGLKQAEVAYKNGWRNDPDKGIIENKLIEEHTTVVVKQQPYKETVKFVDPLIHSAVEIEKVHSLLVRDIKTQDDLSLFPTNDKINETYNQELVPDVLKYKEIYPLRDGYRTALFKKYFEEYKEKGQEEIKPSGLSDDDIELWRTADTGLPLTGTDQRKVFNNGWDKSVGSKEYGDIKNGKVNYKEVNGIEVLKVKKVDIDNEIQKVNEWIGKIQGYEKLRQLDQKEKELNEVIDNLNISLLPVGKKELLIAERDNARNTLLYYLSDPEDGGFEISELQNKENSTKLEWKPRNYAPMNTKILSEFIKATKGVELVKDDTYKAGNIDKWLKSLGAYEIDEELKKNEELLPLAKRGQYLLPFSFTKVRDVGGHELKNLDNLETNGFCQAEMVEETLFGGLVKKNLPQIKGTQGHFPFPTGSGKSTKVVACMKRGGEKDGVWEEAKNRNIILVMPEQVLVESIYKHQNGFCQTWGCVMCQVDGGKIKVKKGTFEPASDEDIEKGNYDEENVWKSHGRYEVLKNKIPTIKERQEGKTFLSIITGDELIGYMARQLLVDRKVVIDDTVAEAEKVKESSVGNPMDDWQPDPSDPEWTAEKIAKYKEDINERLILKDKDIILFDEGHFAIGRWQRIQARMTYHGYKVNRMSATFENQPFSISSTYHRDNIFAGKELDPNLVMGVRDGKEITLEWLLQNEKVWFFAPDLELNAKQVQALYDREKNLPIAYIVYSKVWDPFAESMSYGMPRPSFSIVPKEYGVGQSPDCGLVIVGGKMYVSNLGKRFSYGDPDLKEIPQCDGIQQIGRTGRHSKGFSLLLSLVWKPLKAKNDIESAMVDAMFDGQMKHITDKGYKMLYDANMLRMALALPKKFGSPPAEILIGIKVDEDAEEKRTDNNKKYWEYKGTDKEASKGYKYQPLTKLNWRTEKEPHKDSTFFGNPDKGLWNRYLGNEEKPTMDKTEAKERLLLSINSFIKDDKNFPRSIKIKNQSSLIEYIWGELLSKKDKGNKETLSKETIAQNKANIITEIRKVLNGVINKEVEGYRERGEYNFNKKTSKDKKIIEQIANYYKMSEANVDVKMMEKEGEEGKMVLTMLIEKN
jgi:hypothetical protein